MSKTENDVKVYFVTIPAHKFLHIRNYESNGYWDFAVGVSRWQKATEYAFLLIIAERFRSKCR